MYLFIWTGCALCISCYVCFFFFFKQKTAYEMRISDWSSDVCSSDLMGIWSGAQHLVVAGGVEKMSCTPSVSAPVLFDCENAHLRALHAPTHQGISADLVASIEGFSREDLDRKSTRLNSSHYCASRMPSSA